MKKTAISKSSLFTSLNDGKLLNSYSTRSLKGREIIICKSEYHKNITESIVYDIINNLSSKHSWMLYLRRRTQDFAIGKRNRGLEISKT